MRKSKNVRQGQGESVEVQSIKHVAQVPGTSTIAANTEGGC
jgi:hypothetical protein